MKPSPAAEPVVVPALRSVLPHGKSEDGSSCAAPDRDSIEGFESPPESRRRRGAAASESAAPAGRIALSDQSSQTLLRRM